MGLTFRNLNADEIDVRIATISREGKGLSLLLYKDARCDMNILDETVGCENWQRKHYECKGNLFCSVGILCETSQNSSEWIWKDDCGTESNTEKQKGEASDSFKRACFNWGIGRELYTAPFIWISANNCQIKEHNNKFTCNDKFSVKSISIVNGKIVALEIYNNTTGKTVFKTGTNVEVVCPKCGRKVETGKSKEGKVISPEQVLAKLGMCKNCYRTAKKGEN
jgi:hypothetical protein